MSWALILPMSFGSAPFKAPAQVGHLRCAEDAKHRDVIQSIVRRRPHAAATAARLQWPLFPLRSCTERATRQSRRRLCPAPLLSGPQRDCSVPRVRRPVHRRGRARVRRREGRSNPVRAPQRHRTGWSAGPWEPMGLHAWIGIVASIHMQWPLHAAREISAVGAQQQPSEIQLLTAGWPSAPQECWNRN